MKMFAELVSLLIFSIRTLNGRFKPINIYKQLIEFSLPFFGALRNFFGIRFGDCESVETISRYSVKCLAD